MTIEDINIFDACFWTSEMFDELQRFCEKELTEEHAYFRKIDQELEQILMTNPLIDVLYSGSGSIETPLELNAPDIEEIKRYFKLDCEKRNLQELEMFLLGCRFAMKCMDLLKLTKLS